jgi:hypothetical protein
MLFAKRRKEFGFDSARTSSAGFHGIYIDLYSVVPPKSFTTALISTSNQRFAHSLTIFESPWYP